jgi:hypothetical protein
LQYIFLLPAVWLAMVKMRQQPGTYLNADRKHEHRVTPVRACHLVRLG